MTDQNAFIKAREQATEYLGFAASERIVTDDGVVFEIPNPSLLDDEQQARYDALQLESESWDRHPDILNADGSVKRRGELKEPYRKGNELVEHYNIQLAKAILGERYAAFIAAGGRGNDVNLIWWKMNQQLARRRREDSKSAGGPGPVAAAPERNGSGA
ncbi:hypothetical protein NM962_01175 [Mycobacterium sp. SVM_VP21]|nr:hypothetical protein NM962_01175 [Mycobacterium sp. SVM_VP21]